MHPDTIAGEVRGTLHAFSSSGWIDHELFDIWFNNQFLKYTPAVRPLPLLMDEHTTHYCPETICHKVVLFTLPPNTTHLSQPLDKGCFAPWKRKWKEECHRFMIENPGKVVSCSPLPVTCGTAANYIVAILHLS